jgi:hypothetical protein
MTEIFKLKDFTSAALPHIFCIANAEAGTVHLAAANCNQAHVMLWPGVVPLTSGVRTITVYKFLELQILQGMALSMHVEPDSLFFPDLDFSIQTEARDTRPHDVHKFVAALMDPVEPGVSSSEIYGIGWDGINRFVALFDVSAGLRIGCNGPGKPLIVEGLDKSWRVITMVERLSG